MSDHEQLDVLVFEDTKGQAGEIIEELGLQPTEDDDVDLFTGPGLAGDRPVFARRHRASVQPAVLQRIEEADPKVVVFDYLLSGPSGSEPVDGLELGIVCKKKWPHIGVILVTTGGEGDLTGTVGSQAELDRQKRDHDWPIDYAWIKPWSAAGQKDVKRGVRLPDWSQCAGRLIENSQRPSEHSDET